MLSIQCASGKHLVVHSLRKDELILDLSFCANEMKKEGSPVIVETRCIE
jgi:hypothetical protein